MEQNKNKTALTTIGIDHATNRQIDKLCKRYNLKKGEAVKLSFNYLEKACINPSEPPESTKTELSKINKRQDDLIRFIRHFEEEQLNPMIRATHSIAVRFDNIVKTLETFISSELEKNQDKHNAVLKLIVDKITQHANAINNQAKQISVLYQLIKQDNKQ